MNTNEETALTTQNTDGFTRQQIDLIRRQIAPDASHDELALFLEVCRGTGLNPFMRQIHAVFRNAKGADGRWTKRMTIQTGIDGYRLLAARTGSLAGIDDAIYDDELSKHPGKATVTVFRMVAGQRAQFTATARWSEYVQTDKDGNPTSMWVKMPYLMLGKCAEALALRKAFPAELSGVYTAEEMMQADNTAPLPEPPRRQQEPIQEPVEATIVDEDAPVRAPQPQQPVAAPEAAPPTPPVATPSTDPMALTHASALDQKRLYGQLAARRLHENGGFLRNVTGRDVDVEKLRDGRSDLSVVELARVSERLTRMPAPATTSAKEAHA